MEFIKFVDATGKQWILNKAFIVGMTPTFGSDSWSRGAQIHLDQTASGVPTIGINGDEVLKVQVALGAAM
ncbi:hypothetical protein ACM74C_08240 [Pseudomonas aeruginosa]